MMAVVVSRGSHVHHVPHTGLAQMDPNTMVRAVNSTPTSAEDAASRSHRVRFVLRYAMLAMNTTPKDRYATHADGTCTYMSRIKVPCSTSGGETTSDIMALATNAATAMTARTRSPGRAVILLIAFSPTLTAGPPLVPQSSSNWPKTIIPTERKTTSNATNRPSHDPASPARPAEASSVAFTPATSTGVDRGRTSRGKIASRARGDSVNAPKRLPIADRPSVPSRKAPTSTAGAFPNERPNSAATRSTTTASNTTNSTATATALPMKMAARSNGDSRRPSIAPSSDSIW